MTIAPLDFRRIMGSYPTGVCVITALDMDQLAGMVVGSFTSVSLEPPLVGFFPGKTSTSWPLIARVGQFCINVMASDQELVCQAVNAKGAAKFVGVEYFLSEGNLPIIANSVAAIECKLHSATEVGDHWFVLAEVIHMRTLRNDSPMLFHRGRYCSLEL